MITLQEILERDKRPPSVTVSMLCYNHAKYIDEAIQSVLMQKTNFPVNIVIHDDASPDGSAEIIRRYAAENPNITAIIQPVNLYQNGKSSFPCRVPHYTGKYIASCECDDYWIDEHKLQIQVDYLEANPDCIAVYSNILPVNKYSQYDESLRGPYTKTGAGDYPRRSYLDVRHQTASCVFRNFYLFMTPEEIEFFTHVKSNGDVKSLTMFLNMGRVHYFSEEFAAHRRVIDEGDSWSARMARTDDYKKYCLLVLNHMENYRMVEHFFGKKCRSKYVFLLWDELKGRIKFHKSVLRDAGLDPSCSMKNIPLYAYAALPFYASYKVVKKLAKILLPKKVISALKRFRF